MDREWLESIFLPAANLHPGMLDKRVGLFPTCAPDYLQMDEMSLSAAFKPRGWEAAKCALARARTAITFPVHVTRGYRCEVWRTVIVTGLEAFNIALSITLFANPAVGVALITVMKTMSTTGAVSSTHGQRTITA